MLSLQNTAKYLSCLYSTQAQPSSYPHLRNTTYGKVLVEPPITEPIPVSQNIRSFMKIDPFFLSVSAKLKETLFSQDIEVLILMISWSGSSSVITNCIKL